MFPPPLLLQNAQGDLHGSPSADSSARGSPPCSPVLIPANGGTQLIMREKEPKRCPRAYLSARGNHTGSPLLAQMHGGTNMAPPCLRGRTEKHTPGDNHEITRGTTFICAEPLVWNVLGPEALHLRSAPVLHATLQLVSHDADQSECDTYRNHCVW